MRPMKKYHTTFSQSGRINDRVNLHRMFLLADSHKRLIGGRILIYAIQEKRFDYSFDRISKLLLHVRNNISSEKSLVIAGTLECEFVTTRRGEKVCDWSSTHKYVRK